MSRVGGVFTCAVVAVVVGAAAPAAEADFFVDGSTGSGTACVAGAPCATIQAGVAAAEAVGGGSQQTVHVAAGSYSGEVDVTSGNIAIVGAGRATTSSVANPGDSFALAVTGATAHVSDMNFNIAGGQHGTAAVVRGGGALGLDRVDLVDNGTGNSDDGLFVGVSSTATVGSQSTVTINGTARALEVEGALTMSDSTATSADTNGFGGVVVFSNFSATILVQRSVLNQTNASGDAVSFQTQGTSRSVTATFADDVVSGGANVFDTVEGTADSTLSLYNDFLAAGANNEPVFADASTSTGNIHVRMDSNLLFGTLPAAPHAAITCSYNNFNPGTNPGVTCDHTTNFGINSLYPDGLTPTFDLTAGSAAIDAGDPAALVSGESTTDLHGNPRVLRGNGTCIGSSVRDLGPVEYQGGAGQPLTIAVTGPNAGLTNSPLLFEATGIPGGTYAWDYGDGTTSTDSVTTHHTFTKAGVYSVKATVTDPNGCVGADTLRVTVTSPAGPPSASITAPANGATYLRGQLVRAAYACAEGTAGPGIATCAGPVANGAPIDTSTVGAHSFRVTATSRSGLTGSATSTYTVIARAAPPTISGARESHSKWRDGTKQARISAARKGKRAKRHRAPVGTTFSFRLNEAATVRFTFTRRSKTSGAFSFRGHAGTNKVFFDGPIPRGATLTPGSYKLTISATDGFGQRARSQTLSFSVVK